MPTNDVRPFPMFSRVLDDPLRELDALSTRRAPTILNSVDHATYTLSGEQLYSRPRANLSVVRGRHGHRLE
jgi:hypothetical protein